MTPRARTFSQAPQAVRSARGRGGDGVFPFVACAGRTLHADERDALGLTIHVHGSGNVSGTAAARAVLQIHCSPSVAKEFFTDSRSCFRKVNFVTKHEQIWISPGAEGDRAKPWTSGSEPGPGPNLEQLALVPGATLPAQKLC
jgi:hypothetical protein